jgi:acyl-CoA synthetase (AMP-forming)/AMP-acid ligase II/peptidoglycan/LPS O-acetylase OafA/YrhL
MAPSPCYSFGSAHPERQEYRCHHETYGSLLAGIPSDANPIDKWIDRDSYSNNPENDNAAITGTKTTTPTAKDVLSWFRNDDHVAFYGPPPTSQEEASTSTTTRKPLTYRQLQETIQSFEGYPAPNDEDKGVYVVAILIPQSHMAEMAVVIMTLLAQHAKNRICVTPMDPNMPLTKQWAALEQLQCTALVTTKELYDSLQGSAGHSMAQFADIRFIESRTDIVGLVDWTIVQQTPLQQADFELPQQAEPPALLLRTSGTTSTPKIVPVTASALLYNATCLATSLQLDPETDVGCNAMPLFHIGGISCNLLTVLISGSSIIMMPGPFESNAFLQALETSTVSQDDNSAVYYAQPTWYYGVPSMHKALLFTAKASPNKSRIALRFIPAHLPHATAVELAQVFQTHVIPTYNMSECMPVTSCHDAPVVVDEGLLEAKRENDCPDDTVGVPIGPSLAILDEQGQILPYGNIGQVALQGPGVIHAYIGLPRSESHTAEGWFCTGDMGTLDRNGRLVLSGRTKEMIKRGGDQVWPNEVDGVVESIPGIRLAVTFGVPNELWGEEVHVAVVLVEDSVKNVDKTTLEKEIAQACTDQLGAASAPAKIHYVESPDHLLKGSTGKFLRNRMAEHLGAEAVDTGALHALEAMAAVADEAADAESKASVTPSSALNGVRFLTACFVVQHHVGLMPNGAWARIQTFTLNMSIFFMLGAFQLAASVRSEVKSNSAQFIGTKIGTMHSLFLVSQFFALGSYFLFQCGEGGYAKVFKGNTCTENFSYGIFVANTLTGMLAIFDPVNGPAWFQTSFYIFLIIFPLLDWHLRGCSNCYKTFVFFLNLGIATVVPIVIFSMGCFVFNFFFPSWMPALVAAMIAGYWFTEFASPSKTTENMATSAGTVPNNSLGESQRRRCRIFQQPKVWGVITDVVGLVFVLFEVMVALDGGCVSIPLEKYELARPGLPYPKDSFEVDGRWYGTVCDLTYDEFVDYVHDEPDDLNMGRWSTNIGGAIGAGRLGTSLVLLWLFGLAYGEGITARIMNNPVLQTLGPFAYPLYLLHLPMSRFYWVATRGHEAEFWWPDAAGYPVPVEWYELFFLIGFCIMVSAVLDRFVVQYLSPYTIGLGVAICKCLARFCCCCCRSSEAGSGAAADPEERQSVFYMVAHMVQGLTGNNSVGYSTPLRDLGLDSLGATALLGTLRSCIPCARTLTLAQLSSCETVGDLVSLLEGNRPQQGNQSWTSTPSERADSKPEMTSSV